MLIIFPFSISCYYIPALTFLFPPLSPQKFPFCSHISAVSQVICLLFFNIPAHFFYGAPFKPHETLCCNFSPHLMKITCPFEVIKFKNLDYPGVVKSHDFELNLFPNISHFCDHSSTGYPPRFWVNVQCIETKEKWMLIRPWRLHSSTITAKLLRHQIYIEQLHQIWHSFQSNAARALSTINFQFVSQKV